MTPYVRYSISPCAECTDGTIAACPNDLAEMWTLYGHLPDGQEQVIGGFRSRVWAEWALDQLVSAKPSWGERVAAFVGGTLGQIFACIVVVEVGRYLLRLHGQSIAVCLGVCG